MHMRMVWGSVRQPAPEHLFLQGGNGGKGKGLLCTKAKAAAAQAQLGTPWVTGEFTAAGLRF